MRPDASYALVGISASGGVAVSACSLPNEFFTIGVVLFMFIVAVISFALVIRELIRPFLLSPRAHQD